MKRSHALKAIVGASITMIAGCDSPQPSVGFSVGSGRLPTTFGAQVYATDDVHRTVNLIAASGGKSLRVSVQVPVPFLDSLVAAANARGLRVILLSAYATQPVDIEAYAASTAALQRRYAAVKPIWEIWNEPNLGQYWGAPPNVLEYIRLLASTASALRAAGAIDIWSGGSSGVDLSWIYNLVTNGAFDHANGCAVHSYKPPGFARTEYIQAVGMMPRGIQIHTSETCVASDSNDQVDFFRQMWYLHRELNIPTMVWCEFRDGQAGTEGFSHLPYGLVALDYNPKTIYYAAQQTIGNDP